MEVFFKKLKIELPYDPVVPLLGIYLEKNMIQKIYIHHNVRCSTVYNSKYMEATYMSINRGKDREDVVYINNGLLLSH